MNNLDQFMKIKILTYLDVTKLIEKKAISTEFLKLCSHAIEQKLPSVGPAKFKDLNYLRHYATKYTYSKDPKEIKFIASKYGWPIGNWDVSEMTKLTGLFSYNYDFNENLTHLDTSNVICMSQMFKEAYKFDSDISQWDTSSVTNMKDMFFEARRFNGNISG